MSIPSELAIQALHLLETFGYEVEGSDDEGHVLLFNGRPMTFGAKLNHFDTLDQVLAFAMDVLSTHMDEFVEAANALIQRWETGDLASAVRDLNVCLNVGPRGPRRPAEQSAWLARRLGHLIDTGLTFSDCITAFAAGADEQATVNTARLRFADPGWLEFGEPTVVSRADSGQGAYVMCWAYVPDGEGVSHSHRD